MNSWTTNGPVPTGLVARSALPSTAASHVGEAMNPGWAVRNCGNVGHGTGVLGSPFLPVCRVNVMSSTLVATILPSGPLATSRIAPCTSRPVQVRLKLSMTASALSGVPSVKLMPARTLIVHCV